MHLEFSVSDGSGSGSCALRRSRNQNAPVTICVIPLCPVIVMFLAPLGSVDARLLVPAPLIASAATQHPGDGMKQLRNPSEPGWQGHGKRPGKGPLPQP